MKERPKGINIKHCEMSYGELYAAHKEILKLKSRVETLQEELAEYKRASSCPNCKKLRGMLEQIQEAVAETKAKARREK